MAEQTTESRREGAPAPRGEEGAGPKLWAAVQPPAELERAKMVDWFDPKLLLQTGLEVAVSTVLGRHADARLREGFGQGQEEPYDYTRDEQGQPVDELWLDYVSDLGDGWNSTYAVAYHLAQPTLKLGDTETRRGRILLFGGDEVYPSANRTEYERRTLAPYQTALPETAAPHPHLFAIPGNHDWYDSLVAFTRFFTARKWFGGWQPKQRRSYFALKLPHGWWLLGTDVQLASDIDAPQVEFFKRVAQQMGPEDRVILCNAEPYWIWEKRYGQFDANYYENNLKFLERSVLGRKVSAFIAGDLHHYRRHEDAEGRQKITAGGGGAFLHPTHGADVSELAGGFRCKKSFPDPEVSRKLTWGNLGFRKLNPSFSRLTAVLYVFIAWLLMPSLVPGGYPHPLELLGAVLRRVFTHPLSGLTLLGVLGLFWFTTDNHSKSYKARVGLTHALAHLGAIFFAAWSFSVLSGTGLAWGAARLHGWCLERGGGLKSLALWLGEGWFEFGTLSQTLVSVAGVALAGLFVAPLVMGLYLLVSLNRHGRHSNEAFSAMKIEDWKHFLRLHIDREGHLLLYPVGIRRVPRQWKPREGEQTPSLLVPDDSEATAPELIEPPVHLAHSHGTRA